MPSTTEGTSAPRVFTPTLTLPLRGRECRRGRRSVFPSPSGGGLGWERLPLLCALCLIVLAAACVGSDVIVPPTEEFGGPEFAAVVVTSDLGVGKERLAFGVVSRDGPPITGESATVRTYYLPPNTDAREARQSLTARFEAWPFSAGVFAVYPDFDVAGTWELETEFKTADGQEVIARSAFAVKEASDTPAVGSPAPASVTPLASEADDITHITTASEPDLALYGVSIHEAIAEGKPFVVVFSTPRYCTTGTCGPQLEQVSELQGKYGDRANFIHVEVYKEPHLYGDGKRPGKDDIADAVGEWGLPTEPWTFVVGADGLVKAKFEAFTPSASIESALLETLN